MMNTSAGNDRVSCGGGHGDSDGKDSDDCGQCAGHISEYDVHHWIAR